MDSQLTKITNSLSIKSRTIVYVPMLDKICKHIQTTKGEILCM